jgi:predicted aspartyl protease
MRARRTVTVVALVVASATGGGVLASTRAASAAKPRATLVVGLNVLKEGKNVIALAPVTIDGKGPFTFALDTGASRSLIDSAVAKRLGVRRKGHTAKIAGVNAVSKAQLVKVRSWRVGTIVLPPTTIVSQNMPFGNAYAGIQGLLGSDMLSRFDVVTIDYAHQQLRLHPRR